MKKPKAPKLVTTAITTTITVIFWIFFTLYQVLTTKPAPSVDPKLLEPINPTFDTKTLDKITERGFFEEGSFVSLQQLQPTVEPAPEPVVETTVEPETPTPTQTASEEAEINQ